MHNEKKERRWKKRIKAKLVLYHFEKRKRELLKDDRFLKTIEEEVKFPMIGVYGLYDENGNLYYLGMTRKNVIDRLRHHLKGRHRNKWKTFSLYICKSLKHISALETLFLRLSRPKGNRQAGGLRGSKNLEHILKKRLKMARELLKPVR
ncbi:MAG: GIY-YIG nuclease family protein [Candidatus Caldarchaeum sp.]